MKRNTITRSFNFGLTMFAALLFAVTSCKDKPADSEEVAEEQNEEKFDENSKENDSEFLVDAAELDMMQIQLGKLAQQSTNADIKAHGKMMEDAHTANSTEMKALAMQKGISLPATLTEDVMEDYNKLLKEKPEDFSKKYINMMVSSHEEAIRKYENNAERTDDPEIKAWATKTLAGLRTHLEHTKTIETKIK